MAGLEVVVRPIISPNIRPAAPRRLLPADDPAKGFCKISGNPAVTVSMSHSWNVSISISKSVETERRVDEVRVYQKDDDGKVNKDNFVDIQVANRIKLREGAKPSLDGSDPGSGTPGVPTGGPTRGPSGEITVEAYYVPVHEEDNIEIRERDITKTREGGG